MAALISSRWDCSWAIAAWYAAASCVASLRETGATSVFTVGFCFGGRHSWLATAAGHGLAGAVGFYGRPPLEEVPRMQGPILALQGGADAAIPVEDDNAFDAAL